MIAPFLAGKQKADPPLPTPKPMEKRGGGGGPTLEFPLSSSLLSFLGTWIHPFRHKAKKENP